MAEAKDPAQMTPEERAAERQQLEAAGPKDPAEMTPEDRAAERQQLESVGSEPSGPSFMKDVMTGTEPAFARGMLGLQTSPVTLADMLVKGGGWLGQHLPYTSDETAEKIRGYALKAHEALDPYTYGGSIERVAKSYPEIMHKNETTPGQYWQTGVEWAPGTVGALLTGGESALPTLGKAVSGALTSETAGQLADRYAPDWSDWARMGGALFGPFGLGTARKLVSPGAVATSDVAGMDRVAKAAKLGEHDVPVSAAQQTGSKVWAGLEGKPPKAQMEKLSEGMQKEAGLKPAGTVQESAQNRLDEVNAKEKQLKQNTSIADANKDLKMKIGQVDINHQNTTTPRWRNPEVHDAYDKFSDSVQNGKLSGAKYRELRSEWYKSKSPELNEMAGHLDDAMEKAHPGVWSTWMDDLANAKAMKQGVKQAPTGVIPPGAVNPKRPTELGQLAQAGRMIEPGNYPTGNKSWGELVSALAGAATGKLGGSAEKGVLGYLFGHALPKATSMLTGPIARSAPVQAWAKNQAWRPGSPWAQNPNKRTAAMLLGQPFGAFIDAPENESQ